MFRYLLNPAAALLSLHGRGHGADKLRKSVLPGLEHLGE
jgi:hypothetical protein